MTQYEFSIERTLISITILGESTVGKTQLCNYFVNKKFEQNNMFTIGLGKVTGIISSIGIFISILIINWEIFCYYLIISIILTILYLIKAKKYNVKDRLDRKQTEKVSGMVSELIRGSRDIKMLNAKEGFIDELNTNIKKQNDLHIDMRNVDIKYNLYIGLLTNIFEFILIAFLIYLINNGRITIALA